jgi:hypothetical protein
LAFTEAHVLAGFLELDQRLLRAGVSTKERAHFLSELNKAITSRSGSADGTLAPSDAAAINLILTTSRSAARDGQAADAKEEEFGPVAIFEPSNLPDEWRKLLQKQSDDTG